MKASGIVRRIDDLGRAYDIVKKRERFAFEMLELGEMNGAGWYISLRDE